VSEPTFGQSSTVCSERPRLLGCHRQPPPPPLPPPLLLLLLDSQTARQPDSQTARCSQAVRGRAAGDGGKPPGEACTLATAERVHGAGASTVRADARVRRRARASDVRAAGPVLHIQSSAGMY
jgi:hypothetical protein